MHWKYSVFMSVMILLTSSCGKKLHDKDQPEAQSSITPTLEQKQFSALKCLKNGLDLNDIALVEKSLKMDPELNINQLLENGDTPLIHSIKSGNRTIRNYLLDQGANPNKPNVLNETPLIVAIKSRKTNSIQVLLDLKVKLDEKDKLENVAIHYALKNNDAPTAVMLIKQGANLQLVDNENKNPYEIAVEQKLFDVADILKGLMISNYDKISATTFRSLISISDIKGMKMLLNKFPNMAKEYEYINPLSLTLTSKDLNNSLKMAEILLNASVSVNGPVNAEEPPLIKAVKNKRTNFVDLFISYQADVDVKDSNGNTALVYAVENNDLELVDTLLVHNPQIRYSIELNNKKISYNVCKVAIETSRKLKDEKQIEDSKTIRSKLSCRFWDAW